MAKQSKCPLTNEWITKMWHMEWNGILLSHKKEWNIAIGINMDEPRGYHTKWNKSEKDKYITHTWNLKKNTNKLIHKRETDSQT